MVEYAALLPPYKKLDIKRVLQNIIMRKILLLILNLMAVTLCVVMQSRKLRVLPSKLTLWHFKQDDAERQGRDSSAERVEPDNH